MIIVSACLAGIECKWNGKAAPCEQIIELVKAKEAIPVCPEQLGGLSTPRPPCEQKGAKVFSKDGKDFTLEFEKGADEALKIAKQFSCKKAILKHKSPSCGCGKVYNGTFSDKLIEGDGVTAKLFKENGIQVITENDLI
ncbi:DUF523 domain-containing protein [archaeon]|nr:DUF523 domain-containing protein [archaeon]MBL7057156.1 DUF523 domain-containing protein [Candidatus Woesearchaeota archaeon]